VDDAKSVQVFQSRHELECKALNFFRFKEELFFAKFFEKVAITKFKNEVQVLAIFKKVNQLNKVLVLGNFQNRYFIPLGLIVILSHFLSLDDFNSNLFSCLILIGKANLAKVTLAKCLVKFIVVVDVSLSCVSHENTIPLFLEFFISEVNVSSSFWIQVHFDWVI